MPNQPKLNDQEKALALVAHGMFTDVELADAAADDKAEGRAIRVCVRDRLNRNIILGEMFIVVFAGSEESIEWVMESMGSIEGMKMRREAL